MSAEVIPIPDVHGDPETVLAEIHAQNARIIQQNEEISTALNGILSIASDIKGEVTPLLSRLESNPMFKMLIGKSK